MKTIVTFVTWAALTGSVWAQGSGWSTSEAPAPEAEVAGQEEAAPAADLGAGRWGAAPEAGASAGFTPEEQVATGKFLTALEVKPILMATEANWIGVREYGGQDLLYFTHLLAWRCGLHQIRFAVNGGAMQVFEAEPCYVDTAVPNAITAEDHLPYLGFPLKSVERVSVELVYDDGTTGAATFERPAILIP